MTKPKKYRISPVIYYSVINNRRGLSIAEFPTTAKVSKEEFFMHERLMQELSSQRHNIFALLSPGIPIIETPVTQLAGLFERGVKTGLARISLANGKHRRIHVNTPAPQ